MKIVLGIAGGGALLWAGFLAYYFFVTVPQREAKSLEDSVKAIREVIIFYTSKDSKIKGCKRVTEDDVRLWAKADYKPYPLGSVILLLETKNEPLIKRKDGTYFDPNEFLTDIHFQSVEKNDRLVNTLEAMNLHRWNLPEYSCDLWNAEIAKQ